MPRRILLVVSSMGSGGAERVAASLANAWATRGDSVTLCITYSGRGECFYPTVAGVDLVYLADLVGTKRRSPKGYLSRLLALRNLIEGGSFDVILSFLTHVNVAVLLATRGLDSHVLVCERTSPQMYRLPVSLSAMRRITYPWASRVMMLTTESLAWLRKNIPAARGVVIPNPVSYPVPGSEPVLSVQDAVSVNRKLLLAVGRMDDGKQFDQLLRCFASLAPRHSDWTLAILGDGPKRAELRQLVAQFGLEGRVVMPGVAGNVAEWYCRADLYVLTSRFEGFPNSLAEAMAHGCPAVSYDCIAGPRDIIRHEYDGLLVSPAGGTSALTVALERLMTDDTERAMMRARATQVRDRFSMNRIVRMWDNVFEALVRV